MNCEYTPSQAVNLIPPESIGEPGAVASTRSAAVAALKWTFSFPVLLGTVLAARAVYAGYSFGVDPDLWWHLKTGQDILATHHWPFVDSYSFTVRGQPWIDFEWLGDVAIAAASRLGGTRGLQILLGAVSACTMVALYAYGAIRSRNSKAAFLAAALLSSLAIVPINLRPQMFGYILLIITLIILERFRQGKPKLLWLLPALFLAWVNTHGSWVIGMGVVLLYWVSGLVEFRAGGIEGRRWCERERKQISAVFLLCLAALPITPYGTQLASFPFREALGYRVGHLNIAEWFPMPFDQTGGKLFLFLVLSMFVLQMILQLSWRIEELLLGIFGIATACLHVRFLLLFVPFFIPIMATIIARWAPPYSRNKDRHVLNAILMVGLMIAVVHFFPSENRLESKIAERFPVRALAFMQKHSIPGPIFDSYGFGGYLVWAGQTVFIDGRGQLYEDGGVLSDYLDILNLKPGGLDVLRRYQIESCLLQRGEPLSTVLGAMPEWRKIYSDGTSVIFVRRSPAATGVSPSAGANSEQASPAHGE